MWEELMDLEAADEEPPPQLKWRQMEQGGHLNPQRKGGKEEGQLVGENRVDEYTVHLADCESHGTHGAERMLYRGRGSDGIVFPKISWVKIVQPYTPDFMTPELGKHISHMPRGAARGKRKIPCDGMTFLDAISGPHPDLKKQDREDRVLKEHRHPELRRENKRKK
ncbi:hypothetical protein B0H10DRAFT_1937787 [Mycena sp. CBHHK59/15]|nr:hypothetical protein B0H10DRAFT_1937787 [Mycena sp. CBHHK59/15]